MIEAARARGRPVTLDTTVFPRGGGAWVQALPLWALDGGMAAMAGTARGPRRAPAASASSSSASRNRWAGAAGTTS